MAGDAVDAVGVIGPRLVAQVATPALLGARLDGRRERMTARAGQPDVTAGELDGVPEEHTGAPGEAPVVAVDAVRAEPACVGEEGAVARRQIGEVARGAGVDIERSAAMAATTVPGDAPVDPGGGEGGQVLEGGDGEGGRAVAGAAVVGAWEAVAAGGRLTVAKDAAVGLADESPTPMTVAAGHAAVTSIEGEARGAMVEAHRQPPPRVVAFGAVGGAAVRISVAADAPDLPGRRRRAVAAETRQAMAGLYGEVAVIEGALRRRLGRSRRGSPECDDEHQRHRTDPCVKSSVCLVWRSRSAETWRSKAEALTPARRLTACWTVRL